MLERIAMCSMELGELSIAKDCIDELWKKFGSTSKRAKVLTGMYYEADERFTKAEELYDQVLTEEPNHMMALKRKIGLNIGKRETNKAIKLLCSYLELYCNDREAWKQLSQLYMNQHNYTLAKFCIEELILLAGEDYLLHLQYGEMLYNIGGNNNLQTALKYYCQSVIFGSDDNIRALWGIVLTIRSLRDTGKDSGNNSNNNNNNSSNSSNDNSNSNFNYNDEWIKKLSSTEKDLLSKAQQKIIQCYANKNSSVVDIVRDCLLAFSEND